MTLEEFYKELNYVNSSRKNRLKYANMVLNDMRLFPKLITILFMTDDKVSCRAGWVFEFVCTKNIYALVPYLEVFTANIHKIHFDSAMRPIAKICEFLATAYYSKQNNSIKKLLKPEQIERIIETCFDWMISDGKIAPKVYSMGTLFLFGKDYDWVHPELVQILERDFQIQSSGFKVRAKRTLKKINACSKK